MEGKGIPLGRRHKREKSSVSNRRIGKAKKRLKLLLVENNLVNQKLTTSLLEKRGHETIITATGREAIEAWEEEGFDLILMDVEMPEMDGLEATQAIREKERISGGHVPIIGLTAHAMKGDRERCLAAGMEEYLTKPFDFQVLFYLVERTAGPSPRRS